MSSLWSRPAYRPGGAYSVGAIIFHKMPNGTEQPLALPQEQSASERNYSQVLSLIWGSKSSTNICIADTDDITTILGPKQGISQVTAARMQRWALWLFAYYSIKFHSIVAMQMGWVVSSSPSSRGCGG